MRVLMRLLFLSLSVLIVNGIVFAQNDEDRQASRLPRLISGGGAGTTMNVSGRIKLEGVEKLARRPIIAVLINVGGVPSDRTIANDTGHFFISNVQRQNVSLVVEVDGMEVVRQVLIASAMGNTRVELTIPWPMAAGTAKPGVVTFNPMVVRLEKNEEIFQKALSATKAKETKKAVDLFNQLLSSDPKDFEAWTELGTLFFRENLLDNAEACYFKAIEIKKDYFVALLNLGKLYLNRKQYDNAAMVLSNAAKAVPDSADAHHFLGESYLQIKKGSLAVEHLNEALRLSPVEKADIHLRLAKLYDAAGMKGKASLEYKMFLEKQPDFADKKQLEKYISDNSPR